MKKEYMIPDALAVISLAGACITKHYADRKLGFVRWLNFNGARLRENYPLDTVKYIAAAAALILTVIALLLLIRSKHSLTVCDIIMAVAMTAVNAYYLYATWAITYSVTPCSFLLVPMIGLAAFMLIIRNLLTVKGISESNL